MSKYKVEVFLYDDVPYTVSVEASSKKSATIAALKRLPKTYKKKLNTEYCFARATRH